MSSSSPAPSPAPSPSSLLRRAGTTAAAAALAVGPGVLAAPSASAAPGDNGDIKIHSVGTPFDDPRNEPKVCEFYLAAFNFDNSQRAVWKIEPQPADPDGATRDGDITLAADGSGHTAPIELPNGQYKVTWNIEGGSGAGKHKVFKVECPKPTSSPSSPSAMPSGNVPAGGGGLADGGSGGSGDPSDPAVSSGTAAVTGVLIALALAIGLRLRRRGGRA